MVPDLMKGFADLRAACSGAVLQKSWLEL